MSIPPVPARRPWIVGAFTERPLTKLVALVLALVVWVVVRSEETTDVVLTVPMVLSLEESMEMAFPVPDSVQVVVTGRLRELLKLRTSSPVVRRRFDDAAPRRVRVSLRPEDVEFPVGVQAAAREVRTAEAPR